MRVELADDHSTRQRWRIVEIDDSLHAARCSSYCDSTSRGFHVDPTSPLMPHGGIIQQRINPSIFKRLLEGRVIPYDMRLYRDSVAARQVIPPSDPPCFRQCAPNKMPHATDFR
jgi:hypothetical protein